MNWIPGAQRFPIADIRPDIPQALARTYTNTPDEVQRWNNRQMARRTFSVASAWLNARRSTIAIRGRKPGMALKGSSQVINLTFNEEL